MNSTLKVLAKKLLLSSLREWVTVGEEGGKSQYDDVSLSFHPSKSHASLSLNRVKVRKGAFEKELRVAGLQVLSGSIETLEVGLQLGWDVAAWSLSLTAHGVHLEAGPVEKRQTADFTSHSATSSAPAAEDGYEDLWNEWIGMCDIDSPAEEPKEKGKDGGLAARLLRKTSVQLVNLVLRYVHSAPRPFGSSAPHDAQVLELRVAGLAIEDDEHKSRANTCGPGEAIRRIIRVGPKDTSSIRIGSKGRGRGAEDPILELIWLSGRKDNAKDLGLRDSAKDRRTVLRFDPGPEGEPGTSGGQRTSECRVHCHFGSKESLAKFSADVRHQLKLQLFPELVQILQDMHQHACQLQEADSLMGTIGGVGEGRTEHGRSRGFAASNSHRTFVRMSFEQTVQVCSDLESLERIALATDDELYYEDEEWDLLDERHDSPRSSSSSSSSPRPSSALSNDAKDHDQHIRTNDLETSWTLDTKASLFDNIRDKQCNIVSANGSRIALRIDAHKEASVLLQGGEEWEKAVRGESDEKNTPMALQLQVRKAYFAATWPMQQFQDEREEMIVTVEARDLELLDLGQGLLALGYMHSPQCTRPTGSDGSMLRFALQTHRDSGPRIGVQLGPMEVNMHQAAAQLLYDSIRVFQAFAPTPDPNTPVEEFEIHGTSLKLSARGQPLERIRRLNKGNVRQQLQLLLDTVMKSESSISVILPAFCLPYRNGGPVPERGSKKPSLERISGGLTAGQVVSEFGQRWGLSFLKSVGMRWFASTLSRSTGWRSLTKCVKVTTRATSKVVGSSTSVVGRVATSTAWGLTSAVWFFAGVIVSSDKEVLSHQGAEEDQGIASGWMELAPPKEDEFVFISHL